jgi:hypothetical protein
MTRFGMTLALLLATTPAWAQHAAQGHGSHGMVAAAQPYAGQQALAVTALSADEVQGFLDARGMGLAKPAELNGYPGPMHVLELQTELPARSPNCIERVQAPVRAA